MANITKRTGKRGISYKVQIRLRGVSRTETFGSLAEAKRWASIEEGKIRSSRSPLAVYQDHTVGDLIDKYITSVLPKKKCAHIQKPQLEWWKSKIGHLNISEVSPSILTSLRDELSQRLASGTTNRYLAALSHVFTVGMKDWSLVEHNPLSRIRWMKEPKGRERFLSAEEIDRLLPVCKRSTSDGLYLFVLMALSTGCRKSEILGLKWSSVNFSRSVIELKDTKNGDTRTVPIPSFLVTLLKERKDASTTQEVFPHRFIQKSWETAIRKSGLEGEGVVIHTLRHTVASQLIMTGTDLFTVGRILGHKDMKSTQRYAHLSTEHMATALERMNSKLWQE